MNKVNNVLWFIIGYLIGCISLISYCRFHAGECVYQLF